MKDKNQPVVQGKNRIWELDFIRGFCIWLMIMDHTLYDLAFVFKYRWFPDGYAGHSILYALCNFARNFYFPWGSPGYLLVHHGLLFYFHLRHQLFLQPLQFDTRTQACGGRGRADSYLLRSWILSWARRNEFTIRFGILHMLAASILLYCLLRRLDYRIQLIIALAAIAKGLFFSFTPYETDLQILAVFIHTTSPFQSADYFPLLPWFGYFLLGTVIGPRVYRERRSLLAKFSARHPLRPVTFTGRHSLFFYLFHQPIVYIVLMGISFLAFRS